MKKSSKSSSKKSKKPSLMVELTERKKAQQKTGKKSEPFGKFKPDQERNRNNSNVGPSWGGRKGN